MAVLQKRFAPLRGRAATAATAATAVALSQDTQPTLHTSPPPDTPHALKTLRGVVFDVDGTLCVPQTYMFGQMRDALGITSSVDILDHIYALPSAAEQHVAMDRIRAIERAAMTAQQPQPGLTALMAYLDARNVPKAICTRNFAAPVEHLLRNFLDGHVFQPIVTRDFRPPKPDPAGILHIARTWGLTRPASATTAAEQNPNADTADRAVVLEEQSIENAQHKPSTSPALEADASGLIMVGDSIDDMTAGHRAGAATVLLVNDVNKHLVEHAHTDLVITRLDDLIDVLENGFVGRTCEQDRGTDAH